MSKYCSCGYDRVIGQNAWCYYHKGPHPLMTHEQVKEWLSTAIGRAWSKAEGK
jgi:hypothetical protein